jgi:hypothetical protein
MIGWAQIAEAAGITAAIAVYLFFGLFLWARLQVQRLPDDEGDDR